ncbi:hypothetical protein ALC60_10879 [Trachymyrmex zeteki]|uniref:Uncharacterized protein n=1 Tax=Mycetomoellerius zeteki TaxID=64791 RepID=A0A151WQC1_9HYME|nr:hypothetical protein ALC60_10879 [Trachymyrmex zeteki]
MSLTPAYEQHTEAWKCERATAARLRFASSGARAQFTTPRAAEETRATRRRPGTSKLHTNVCMHRAPATTDDDGDREDDSGALTKPLCIRSNDQTRARRSHRTHRCRLYHPSTRLLANAERARAPHYIAFIAPRFSRHECPTSPTRSREPARGAPETAERLTGAAANVPRIFNSNSSAALGRSIDISELSDGPLFPPDFKRLIPAILSTPCIFLMRAVF